MKIKRVSVDSFVKKVYDFSMMFYLASWVVFSQQAGTLATAVVHFSTGLVILASVLLLIVNRLRISFPAHLVWYCGFIALIVTTSVLLNGTNAVYTIRSIMCRIVFLSFFVTVRLQTESSFGEYIVKLSWVGILEIVLLLMCVPAQEWVNALRSGHRLGAGSIQVNMCSLTLAFSVVFCFFGIWEGYKRYIAIGAAESVVILLFQSRISYLVIVAGVVLFLVSYYRLSQRSARWYAWYGLAGICLGGYIMFFSDIGHKFMNRIFAYDDSIIYRLLIIKTSLRLWWEKPFIGYGYGTMRVLMKEILGRAWAAHNNMIGLIMCVGIIGFLYYYIYVFYWGTVLLSRAHRDKDMSMAFSILTLTVLSDISAENYYTVLVQALLAIAIGAAGMNRTKSGSIKRRIK